MKRTPLILGGLVGVAALWSGAWFAGKTFLIEPRADAAVEQLRSGATFFSFDKRVISGFPFGYDVAYENVAISDASTLWRWTAPSLRLETGLADAGAMTVTASETSVLVVEPQLLGGVDGSPMVFDIVSDGLSATLSGDETDTGISISAAGVTMTQKEGVSVITGGKAALSDLSAEIESRPETGEYLADIDAGSLSVTYRLSRDGVNETSNLSDLTGIEIDIETRAISGGDLGAFLANDGAASVRFSARSYKGTAASSGGPSAPPVSVFQEAGETVAELSLVDGRARYAGAFQDVDARVDVQAPGPLSKLAFVMKKLELSMEMPLKQAEAAQPYAIELGLDTLEVADAVWATFDPFEKLDRSAMKLEVEIAGGARVLTDFMGAHFNQAPIDLETLEIRELELEALGAKAEATGAFDIAGDASRSEGAMTLEVEGGLALLDDLAAAGLIPAQAVGAYQALIGQFAVRDGDDDRLTTTIESRRGQVSVNGRVIRQ